MNTLTPDIHKNNNFSEIIKTIEQKQNLDNGKKEAIDLLPNELIGTKINNYVLTEYVHSGGFGAVFKARHINLDTISAIKISHQITKGFKNLDSIVSIGLKGLKLLNHNNIVRTEDFIKMKFNDDERLVIVMEYVNGGTLNEIKKENLNKTEIKERLDIFKKVCEAIYHAHTTRYRNSAGFTVTGLMHGDIKPANILLTNDNEPKVMDFMFVDMNRLLEIEVNAPEYVNISDYATAAFGTIGYMPPEQQIQGEVTEQTDIYALGVLLFEILCPYQFKEFTFESPAEIHNKLKEHNKELPIQISNIIFKSTQEKPSNRYLNIKELILEIEKKERNIFKRLFKIKK